MTGRPRTVAFRLYIGYTIRVAFDLKEIVAVRLGENYQLHKRRAAAVV